MAKYLIGTGGWAYFKAPNKPSLKAYSETFNFVEANYTFYKYPRLKMAETWRRVVPHDFTFTVRCHQDLTHKAGLKPVAQAYAAVGQMIVLCKILNAPFLHLLTPASYTFNDTEIEQAKEFLSTVNFKGIRLAWEVRSPITSKLADLMRDFDIIHSVDLSKEQPSYQSDTVYARIFGKGKHNIYQFTDEELMEIDHNVLKSEAETVLVTFHGIRMSSDAVRFRKYKETGEFLPVTAYTGIDSAIAVLSEDAKFPSTKAELIDHQGWKVIDAEVNRRIHLSDFLSKIPDKTYHNAHEVIEELKVFL